MHLKETELYLNILLGFLGSSTIVGFIVAVIYYFIKQRKKQAKKIVDLKEKFKEEMKASLAEMKQFAMERVAEELHDGIKNELNYININIQHILPTDENWHNKLKNYTVEIDTIVNDIRNIARRLLEGQGLKDNLLDSINNEIFKLKTNRKIKITYQLDCEYNYFEAEIEIIIFRMLQEILQNAIKHAKESNVFVRVYENNNNFIIQVKDDGKGFNVDAVLKNKNYKGIGLKNLYSRAKLIGGKVNIISEIEKGSTFTITIPIPPDA